ncbi:MAG: class I SAM-dependent methyltransferase [Bacteroidales bacterium]|nr:class I SAM-dependent methyltransferase [Bacteroidales bacterium]
MAKTAPFDHYLDKYEQWFHNRHYVFMSELEAIRMVLPSEGRGIEVGVGSGIFAAALGITEGCDPSVTMLAKARERGINAVEGIAENLPYMDESIDFVLMVTTICFVDDAQKSFEEIKRVLKPGGKAIVGFVDKNSPVGKTYLRHKEESIFYKDAEFFSTEDIYHFLWYNNFKIDQTCQTVFGSLDEVNEIQQPEKGSGKGSFVVIRAIKADF